MPESVSGTYRFNPAEGRIEKISDRIPSVSTDAFFKEPYFDSNLADNQHPHGQEVVSKKHKKRIMRSMDLNEGGDLKHGAR